MDLPNYLAQLGEGGHPLLSLLAKVLTIHGLGAQHPLCFLTRT